MSPRSLIFLSPPSRPCPPCRLNHTVAISALHSLGIGRVWEGLCGREGARRGRGGGEGTVGLLTSPPPASPPPRRPWARGGPSPGSGTDCASERPQSGGTEGKVEKQLEQLAHASMLGLGKHVSFGDQHGHKKGVFAVQSLWIAHRGMAGMKPTLKSNLAPLFWHPPLQSEARGLKGGQTPRTVPRTSSRSRQASARASEGGREGRCERDVGRCRRSTNQPLCPRDES